MSAILIVDDHEQNRYLLRSILTATGDQVLEATNGAEALELARRTRPDLIVSDILMPQMDGFAFCRECKCDEQLREIPFVFYTATYTDARDEALALRLGAARFIIKPVESEKFIEILRQVRQEHASGKLTAPPQPLEEETTFYRLYNEALVRKLEDKMFDLEQVNRRLVESEEHFRRLAENAPDLIYRYEFLPHRSFTYVNPAAIIITGYTPEEHYANPDLRFKIIHPDDHSLLEAAERGETGSDQPLTLRWIHKDGRLIWTEQRIVPIFSEARELIAIEGIVRDVTERKQHERELEAIATVSAALCVAPSCVEMLPIILDHLLSLLEVDGAALAMLDSVSGNLHTELGRGVWMPLTDEIISPDVRLNAQVLAINQPYLNNDVRNDQGIFHPDAFSTCRATAGAPLQVQGQIIGLVWIGSPHPLTDHDLRLLIAITDIAANAIHRAALYEETTRRMERLKALKSIDYAITSNFDLRVTINILLEHVAAQLRVDAAALLLLNSQLQTLDYAAGYGFHTPDAENRHIYLRESFAGRAATERRIVQVNDFAQIQERPHFAALWASEGFVSYHGVPVIAKGQVKGVLEVYHRTPFAPDPDWIGFLETLAGQAAIAIENAQLFKHLQRSNMDLIQAYDATIEGWARALDMRDKETEGHTRRVTEITERLARAMGVSEADIVHIRRGALLHDIGKMGVPDSILLKPAKLTDQEWALMRQHPQYASDMLAPIAFLRPALDIPINHHEKWDGTGYPRGLKGEQIPLAARIFAVADVWDALHSDRRYRKAWAEERVIEHIKAESGRHFDPKVVELFLKVMSETPVLAT